jgi:hypothetical protein
MPQSIVIHTTFGGFHLTPKQIAAITHSMRQSGDYIEPLSPFGYWEDSGKNIDRHDPALVAAVLAHPGNNLKVVTIPDDVNWRIEKYGGREWVAEVHRTWS